MIGLSFGEIIIILIVGLLIINPKDIPVIIRYLRKIKSHFTNLTNEFSSTLTKFSSDLELNNKEDLNEINRLLKEICDYGGKYEGDYDLVKIKKVHSKIVLSSKSLDNGKSSKDN
jgi:Sec-independent protein translocase protein TatA